jgi:hypothetical protein
LWLNQVRKLQKRQIVVEAVEAVVMSLLQKYLKQWKIPDSGSELLYPLELKKQLNCQKLLKFKQLITLIIAKRFCCYFRRSNS